MLVTCFRDLVVEVLVLVVLGNRFVLHHKHPIHLGLGWKFFGNEVDYHLHSIYLFS